MHAVPVYARKGFLAALVALALLAGALFVATPKASANISQCSANTACAWSNGGWEGQFSWWPLNSGCHFHENNPSIRSIYNRTTRIIEVPGRGLLIFPGEAITLNSGVNSITGQICT